jgi:hypothetical protein
VRRRTKHVKKLSLPAATRVKEAERYAALRERAATVKKLRPGAVRKFSLAMLVLIASTVAMGAAVDSAAAALRVRRDVDFSTGGAADGARACAAASLASASARDVSAAATVASGASVATAAAAPRAGPHVAPLPGADPLVGGFDGAAVIWRRLPFRSFHIAPLATLALVQRHGSVTRYARRRRPLGQLEHA